MKNEIKDNSKIVICAMVCVILIIFGILFWPTLYRYDKIKYRESTLPIRINRITGYTKILHPEGWRQVNSESKAIPNEEKDKISLIFEDIVEKKLDMNHKSTFDFDIYNGSSWMINKIRLSIVAKDKEEKKVFQRLYDVFVNIPPFSAHSCSMKITVRPSPHFNPYGILLRNPEEWADEEVLRDKDLYKEITIKEAFGYKAE